VHSDPVNGIDPSGTVDIFGFGDIVAYAPTIPIFDFSGVNYLFLPQFNIPIFDFSGAAPVDPTNSQTNSEDVIEVQGRRRSYTASQRLLALGGSVAANPIVVNAQAPQNNQCAGGSFQPAEYTPQGDTKGENAEPIRGGYGGYNTDLPGSTLLDAGAVYTGLTRLAGDTSSRTLPDITRPTILSRSYPSGIQLRLGSDLRYRIDIPANTFQLRVPETIHFRGGKGNMCPTR
jgi:hypothetical protein